MIADLISSAPPLTDDQVQQLTSLLHVHPRLAAPSASPAAQGEAPAAVQHLEQRRTRLSQDEPAAPMDQAAAR